MNRTVELEDKRLKVTVRAGLLAALTCVATMVIRIPTIKGYVHLGDALVIASGILLGGATGGLAAGIGSMLADILGGYYVFAIATFIIKALSAFAAGTVFKVLGGREKKIHAAIRVFAAGLLAEIIMVIGYFSFEVFYEGTAAAIAEILPNTLQGVTGIVISVILVPALLRNHVINE